MLPVALLGHHAACAELALGTTFRLPDEFIKNTKEEEIADSQEYVRKLRQIF